LRQAWALAALTSAAAAVMIPTANAASNPKIRKRMMVSPYLPPVVVTAKIMLFVVSFHCQSVAIPALPWLKETLCWPI
jgi:hypothetical protein